MLKLLDQTKQNRRGTALFRAVLLLAVLVVVVCVFYIVSALVKEQQAGMARFPDGVVVTLLGAAYGNTTFTTEKWWEKALRRILPASFTRWIPPAARGGCSCGTNSITAYVQPKSPTGTNVSPDPWAQYIAEDDTGFRFPSEAGSCVFSGGGASLINGLMFRVYPRRQREFWVRFLDTQDRVLASLRVPNPVQGPFPEWEPLPLPQTLSNGPVTLTLRSLDRGDQRWERLRFAWQVSSTNAAWEKAAVTSWSILDSTGNEGPWLSPAEKAWKIRASVAQEKLEQFSAAERFSVTNLSLPSPGEFQAIDVSRNLDGVQVNLQLIAGPGRLTVSNNLYRSMEKPVGDAAGGHSTTSGSFGTVETWGPILKSFLMLKVDGLREKDGLRVRLTGADGRHEDLQTYEYSGGAGNSRIYTLQFDTDRFASPLGFELAVSRAFVFEFLVAPPK